MDIKKALEQIKSWDPEEMTPLHNKEFERFLKRFVHEMTLHLNLLADGNAQVATRLAKALLKLGNDPHSPCHRIQFIGGEYPDNEKMQGGMTEHPLIRFFTEELDKLRQVK